MTNNFDPEEVKKSKRIFKSATPKYDLTWYIKWGASIITLFAIIIRASGVMELHWLDMLFSWIGALGWAVVGFMWKDRAILLLNGVIGILLFAGLLNYYYGGKANNEILPEMPEYSTDSSRIPK